MTLDHLPPTQLGRAPAPGPVPTVRRGGRARADRAYASSVDPETRTLYVCGTVSETSVGTFGEDVRTAVSRHRVGAVDLTHVDFMPAAATRALAGVPVDIRVADGSVPHRVLAVCGLPHAPW